MAFLKDLALKVQSMSAFNVLFCNNVVRYISGDITASTDE